MISCLVVGWLVCAQAQSGVVNGDFSDGLKNWTLSQPAMTDVIDESGAHAAHIGVAADAPVGYPALTQDVVASPGDVLRAEADGLGRGLRDGAGAYLSFDFFGADGNRITNAQSPQAGPNDAWMHLSVETMVPPGTAKTRLCLVFNGRGDAYFKHVSLARTAAAAPDTATGAVTLTVTDRIACESLVGFGFEDDGWFYNKDNAQHGVTDADYTLREDRIRWLDPDWIRMFFWYKDWNPSGDWETFDFDTPNMQSHYRTLDLYQKLGARVDVTGVEWGVKDPYGDPAKAAKAIGALLQHLIKDKGYTCVSNWTLTNEPNGYFVNSGYTFDRFREMHTLLKEELTRRALDVHIVGSDDTNGGMYWFEKCVKDDAYFGTADLFSSHRYFHFGEIKLAGSFFKERLDLLAARTPHKPLLVTEFGFQDNRTSGAMVNPVMGEYPYALWTSVFVIDGLNRGIAGFSIWCVQQMYYPGGGFMTYGLWEYKDTNWKPRPVYYAWSPFTRLTEPGDKVRVCESNHSAQVSAVVVGNSFFWVNQGEQPVDVEVKGVSLASVRVMTEPTLSGDRECGNEVAVQDGKFNAPGKSFGYGKVVK